MVQFLYRILPTHLVICLSTLRVYWRYHPNKKGVRAKSFQEYLWHEYSPPSSFTWVNSWQSLTFNSSLAIWKYSQKELNEQIVSATIPLILHFILWWGSSGLWGSSHIKLKEEKIKSTIWFKALSLTASALWGRLAYLSHNIPKEKELPLGI